MLPRRQALDEFRADAARVNRFFEDHAEPYPQGVALCACHRQQLFEALQTGVLFDDQVVLDPRPELFQLARVADENETAVSALVDTITARIFHYARMCRTTSHRCWLGLLRIHRATSPYAFLIEGDGKQCRN